MQEGREISDWDCAALHAATVTLAEAAVLPVPMLWFVRIGVPLSAILISAGFFFSVLPPTVTQASGAVSLIYTGALILAVGVVTLGIGLLRSPQPS